MDENHKLVEAGAIEYIKQVAAGDAEYEKQSMEVLNECKNTPESSNEYVTMSLILLKIYALRI